MIRFLLAFRNKLELILEKYMGQHEFSVVPSSLFTSNGKLSLELKKAVVVHGVKEEMKQANA